MDGWKESYRSVKMKAFWDDIIFDIESDGLLPEHAEPPFCMTEIHCLVIKDVPTGRIRHFARDNLFPLSDEDIADLAERGLQEPELLSVGIDVIAHAKKRVVGHNIIDFDLPAIEMIFPGFETSAAVYDTLPMVRMVFADVKDKDFRMAARGTLDGRLIGTHGLEAWGQRLDLMKGDYKKDRTEELKEKHKEAGLPVPTKEELHKYVWGTWNVAMHAYMLQDAEVNEALLIKIEAMDWSEDAVQLEHEIHALMVQQERNGFFFDREKGVALGVSLQEEYDRYAAEAYEHIGRWYRPARWHDEELINVEHGEGPDRRTWGNVHLPKRSMNFTKSNSKLNGDYRKMRANTIEGVPICKVEVRDFNPNSRQQIVDRLTHLYGWTPQDFTEKGSARVDDTILRELVDHIPLAETLAEIFYYKKRIGMVVDGKNGWLKLCKADQRIHGRVNVGGTVTGRATHAAPNISQVTGVTPIEVKANEAKGFTAEMARKKYDGIVERHIREGTYVLAEWYDRKSEGAIYVRGREGNHGWDCRELFTIPPGFKLVGCDLSGIEFRCLGNLTFPFDDGEIIDVVLNGDIHQRNADAAGIGRGVAKRLLYAAMYGGGDAKLGSIVEPLASEGRQKSLGKDLRGKLMSAMPSLNLAIKAIHKEARRNGNTIAGLDGRRLYIRAKHAALNMRLQSDGALIAKKWCLLTDDLFYDEGWTHSTEAEYAFCSWSHDEIQVAVREEYAEQAAEMMEAAAPMAGDYFNFKCPVAAQSKIGDNWAQTH